jgi:hypothetical protein
VIDTRDLALYGAIVGTIGGLWSLYTGILLDRARVRVRASDGVAVTPGTKNRTSILMVHVSNRGRRGTSIQTIGRVVSMKKAHGAHELSGDIMKQLVNPVRLAEGEGRTFVHGQLGGYQSGEMPTRR